MNNVSGQEKTKEMRIYVDGIFDLSHSGHFNAMRQAKTLGDVVVVGINSDEDALNSKGVLPIYTQEERGELISGCKWVDEVIVGTKYNVDMDLLVKYNCDYAAHGSDIAYDRNGKCCYEEVRKHNKLKVFERSYGISSTTIINHLLHAVNNANKHLNMYDINSSVERGISFYSGHDGNIDKFENMSKSNNTINHLENEEMDIRYSKKIKDEEENIEDFYRANNSNTHFDIDDQSYAMKITSTSPTSPTTPTTTTSIASTTSTTTNITTTNNNTNTNTTDTTTNYNTNINANANTNTVCSLNKVNNYITHSKDSFRSNQDNLRIKKKMKSHDNNAYPKCILDKSSCYITASQIYHFVGTPKKHTINRRVVYVDGSFDIFHIGHLRILESAKKLGDFLLVGLHSDEVVRKIKGKYFPVVSLLERTLNVLAMKVVDDVVIGAPWVITESFIKRFHIDVVLRGTIVDYTYSNYEIDPYALPKKMGIFQEISSESVKKKKKK
uniref:ethanolamine-phosphate cytidylyltransferase n=1 Tax=Piliocolobus tephrosceles TaxID=591936 RepID=A0A8C9H7Q9_9PRIM